MLQLARCNNIIAKFSTNSEDKYPHWKKGFGKLNILKEVFTHEVYPALGCTEPVAVAFAASAASAQLPEGDIDRVEIIVDPAIYKNGMAVPVPNADGERGNLIAGVLGALIKKPASKMEILDHADDNIISQAKKIIQDGRASITIDQAKKDIYIRVKVFSESDSAVAVIENGHTNLVYLCINDQPVLQKKADSPPEHKYRSILKEMTILEMIDIVEAMDSKDRAFIQYGIDMNLAISKIGLGLHKVGFYIHDLTNKGFIQDDIFSSTKIQTASASDARMSGVNMPVMTSGGSGNQGIVSILVPYNAGRHYDIPLSKIINSIALSHMVNSYVKCHIGELSPLCGASISAGVGAAVAIVYQQCGKDQEKITLAVNNMISDLGGMLCDGAKESCALKVATSTDSAIRSAYMAINNHGITIKEGFVGKTAEETIYHLSKISKIGMGRADETMLEIMISKN